MYIADTGDFRVREIGLDGIISTIAGHGGSNPGDGGPALSASLLHPTAVALDTEGNLYIAAENRIRKVTINGRIETVAGNGTDTYSGDGGPATAAGLHAYDVAVDGSGNLHIFDGLSSTAPISYELAVTGHGEAAPSRQ